MLPIVQFLLLLSSSFLLTLASVAPNNAAKPQQRFKNYEDFFLSQVEETTGRRTRSTRSFLKYDDEVEVKRGGPEKIPEVKREIRDRMDGNKLRRQNQMANKGVRKTRSATAAHVSTETATKTTFKSNRDVIATQDITRRVTSIPRRQDSIMLASATAPATATPQPAMPLMPADTKPAQLVQPSAPTEPNMDPVPRWFLLRMQNIYVLSDPFDNTGIFTAPYLLWMPSRHDISLMVDPETGEY